MKKRRPSHVAPDRLAEIVALYGDLFRDANATERAFFVMKDGAVCRNEPPH